MKKSHLLIVWCGMFILCAGLGFIPNPVGFGKFACIAAAMLFFVPGAMVLYLGYKTGDIQGVRLVRNLSGVSLSLSLALLIANLFSAFLPETVRSVFESLLIILSAPMVCSQAWGVSLFLWACLLFGALELLRRGKKKTEQ